MEFLKNIFIDKNLNAVCVFRGENGSIYHLIKTNKKNNKITVIFKESFDSFETLEPNIDKSSPIQLVVDGKGIINKAIDLTSSTDTSWLKNIEWQSMHFTTFTDGNNQLFSICRKAIVDAEIEKFTSRQYQIGDYYVGPLTAILLEKWTESPTITANETVFEFRDEKPVSFQKTASSELVDLKIGEEVLNQNQVALFGAVVNFYINQESLASSENILVNREELFYKNLFVSGSKYLLFGSFALLLVLYLATGLLNSKVGNLKVRDLDLSATSAQIQALSDEKTKKLEILNAMGYASTSYISKYAHDIISAIPESVSVLSLDIFPLQNEIKENKKVKFASNEFSIMCSSRDELSLNDLLVRLNNLIWVDKVEVVSLRKDKKENTFFEIKILSSL